MADTAVKTETKVEEKPKMARVVSQNFGAYQFKRNQWFYELTEAQQPEDLLRPEFWADIVGGVRGHDQTKGVGDIILFDKPDTGWAAFGRIDALGAGYMKVRLFSEAKPNAVPVLADNSPLKTRWNPGRKCHEVIRTATREVLAGGFQDAADAHAWITNHRRDMAA